MRTAFFLLGLLLACAAAEAASLPAGATRAGDGYALTVYFTPLESGYTEAAGFRYPSMRINAVGRRLSPDFIHAVEMEGCGRLSRPAKGKGYLRSDGSWQLASAPVGISGRRLVPRVSCAVGAGSGLKSGDWIVLRSPSLPASVQGHAWRVDDRGGGVGARQIDLYWGEDVSKGPGRLLTQAAGSPLSSARNVTVYKVPPPQ
ncbi:MAG: hypothetical protein PW734_02320 [Verrucomicrobium sp.]|nr:hypothetical protein [Verrucomicrobium sp.]